MESLWDGPWMCLAWELTAYFHMHLAHFIPSSRGEYTTLAILQIRKTVYLAIWATDVCSLS